MKRYTEKKAAALFESILALVRKERGPRDTFADPWTSGDGAGIACDGYRLVKINAGIPAGVSRVLTASPRAADKKHDCSMQARAVSVTLDAAMQGNYTLAQPVTDEYIKAHARPLSPGGRSAYVRFPGTETHYNAQYLRQLINLFPDGRCYICREKGRRSPLVIVSAFGSAYLMPYYVLEQGER